MHKFIQVTCVVASLFAASAVQAETWPSRLIRATIPFGAGSAADVVPRLVFDRLAGELGEPMLIENRFCGGGRLGSAMVAKGDPDWYRILSNSSSLTFTPAILTNLTYDVSKDLTS